MNLIDTNKIRLTDLSNALGVTGASIRYHMKNNSGGLGEGAVKLGDRKTDDWLLPIDSVLNYLQWAIDHSRHVKFDTIIKVEAEIKCLKAM